MTLHCRCEQGSRDIQSRSLGKLPRVIHSASSGSGRCGICLNVSDVFSLKGWTYFLAGVQEKTTVLTYKERDGGGLLLSLFRSLLGETSASSVNI